MCGEDDDGPGRFTDMLYERYAGAARALLERQGAKPSDPVIARIDELFSAALGRALKDTEGADDERRYALLSMQPLVFARLAGFLAGHLALQEDPLRKVMEAMMHGYAEAENFERGHDHGDGGWHTH
ncbi:MAG: hypothetical protein FJX29_05465 [Alphaproteobacteria bacterium]|nr:hypothetical protein [Alphaproteobacteria bacterium]